MNKLKIGVLGPSEIAFRKFLPAVKSSDNIDYAGVAIATNYERNALVEELEPSDKYQKSIEKAVRFKKEFGGDVFNSFEEVITSSSIHAVYIPLPPALHYFWAKKSLLNGKHVLLEKPFTTEFLNTMELINIAREKQLAIHENYAFCYHEQINRIIGLVSEGNIGEIRQVRAAFGFPYRGSTDFRYSKALGGGSLLDCGGYPVKVASMILGETAKVVAATLSPAKNHEVDIFGSATLKNKQQITAQVSFGMDNTYKCELEIWGSLGSIFAPRVFTAPSDFSPEIVIKSEVESILRVPEMDQFLGSVEHFYSCIIDAETRNRAYDEIRLQSKHINDILKINANT